MPRRPTRRGHTQVSEFQRGRMTAFREAGWSYRRIARHEGRSDETVRRCCQQWFQHAVSQRAEGSGRPRRTTRRTDRAIVRAATTTPTATLSTIQRHLPTSPGRVVSRRTIGRRLAEAGLHCRRPLRRLPLTPAHRQQRLLWCRARAGWTVADWSRIVFSDESRFTLGPDDRRIHVWRRPGQRCSPHVVVERHTSITPGVTVWGAIASDTRSPLVILRTTLTGRRYVDDVLRPVVVPMLSGLPGAIFQHDNARPHAAHVATDFLRNIATLPWPSRSPDLSPIEHVWDMVGRRLQPSHNVSDLAAQLHRIWRDIPQDSIRRLYASMPDRISACIDARGGATPY